MIESLAKKLVKLKQDFVKTYDGTSNIQEIIPLSTSDDFPVDENHLKSLHIFAKNNPIYYNSYEQTISDVSCVVYEGDINKYWLNSIQHASSHAPFSPTWIFSAYLLSLHAKKLGYKQVIDIGSGDGRIAFCAKIVGLDSFSFEIDQVLVNLQNLISDSTGINFNSYCTDATVFDYSKLNLETPIFFIGGLAQMGGIALASGVIENIRTSVLNDTGMVFAGTFSQKYHPDPMSNAGWGTLIHKNNLHVSDTIILPTVWSFKESDDTPYIFSKFIPNSNPN